MRSILVACVGNIFNGDDAFGVEVARRLAQIKLPNGVRVIDFGIRGIDLTYALMDDYDAVILVDAAQRGEAPGAVSIVEPDRVDMDDPSPDHMALSPHDLDPAKVLRLASALGGSCQRVLLVACEPLALGGEEGVMGLSAPVAAAVGLAAETVEELIDAMMAAQPAPRA
ncbi:MAG: hydrogenase maturation protease [Methylocystis sp.]